MNRIKILAAATLIVLSLAACGGGVGGDVGSGATDGGTNNGTSNATPTTTDTVIAGMATKGPITGTVNIYALKVDGSKGSLLTSAPIVNGSYSATIGKYAVPVIIEVTGSYLDEATGQPGTIAADAPMRAALANASGTISVAVTPLTELAVQKAGTLTPSAIDAGNKLISDIFKVDIINTLPVAPTTAAVSSATRSQLDYTLAIAALSQLSATRGEPLSATLASVAGGISASGMNSQTVTNFQRAVTAFMTNANNKTGVTDISATDLAAINGGTTAAFTLAIQGNMAANAIKGIQFEVVIPAGLTIRSDAASSTTLPGIVTVSATAAAVQPYIASTFSPASGVLAVGLLTNTGIGPGWLATITCDILPGWPTPSATAFSVRNIKAVDGNTAVISGVNVTVN